jgi:hypothetical protein
MAGGSPHDDDVLAHIASISSQTHRDADQLAETLHGRSWPGGSSDRSEPGALAWVRRWRPGGPAPLAPLCGCAKGRCLLCN